MLKQIQRSNGKTNKKNIWTDFLTNIKINAFRRSRLTIDICYSVPYFLMNWLIKRWKSFETYVFCELYSILNYMLFFWRKHLSVFTGNQQKNDPNLWNECSVQLICDQNIWKKCIFSLNCISLMKMAYVF